MKKKKTTKLTAEFWRRDAAARRELERRIVAGDAKHGTRLAELLPPRLSE
jgi:hypothetical protein